MHRFRILYNTLDFSRVCPRGFRRVPHNSTLM